MHHGTRLSWSGRALGSSRDKDFGGRNQFDIFDLGPHPHSLQAGFFLWLGEKCQQILVIQTSAQILEIWRKGDGSLESEKIRLAAGLRRDLRKIVLAPVNWPLHTAKMTNARREDRVDKDAGFLGLLECSVDIWICGTNASEAINAICDHQNLTAHGTFRPTLDEVGNG